MCSFLVFNCLSGKLKQRRTMPPNRHARGLTRFKGEHIVCMPLNTQKNKMQLSMLRPLSLTMPSFYAMDIILKKLCVYKIFCKLSNFKSSGTLFKLIMVNPFAKETFLIRKKIIFSWQIYSFSFFYKSINLGSDTNTLA